MGRSAHGLAAGRSRLWRSLQAALAKTPALAACAGQPLARFAITDPAQMRGDYGAWNSVKLSQAELCALADTAEHGETAQVDSAISAGWSSGSGGGARGLFAASPAERADYIGQSLARLLPARALLSRQRLALHLRASNALYEETQGGRFAFAHFPLEAQPSETLERLQDFAPTILIAPPHRLLAFARAGGTMPSLRHLFCGSEPISPAETRFLAAHFGIRPRSIYQATEGFLGAECEHGHLHLNDHALEIELEPVPGTQGFRPIITDLRRTTQPIVRVRGDDFLELDPHPCACGYAGRGIRPPQGRVNDIWRFGDRAVTPADVVRALDPILGAQQDWQALATREEVTVRVSPHCSNALGDQAVAALRGLADRPVDLVRDLSSWAGPKRRRVVWTNG